MILNPIYAVILWALWMFQPQDRRLVYLSMVFSIGSLSLVERIPVEYTGLGAHALQMIHLLAAGLIAFPFIALEGLEKEKKYQEIVGNMALAGVVFAALFFVPRTEMNNLRWFTFTGAMLATGYFIHLLSRKIGKGPLPINDMRRLLITVMAAAEILSQIYPQALNGGVAEFLDVFFPVAFPAYFTVFMILGFVTQERMNMSKDRAGMAVRRISNIVCSADCYDEKLSNIQDIICSHLDAERSTIYLSDLKGNTAHLRAQAIYGPTDKLKEVALEIDPEHGLIGRVMKTRAPLLVDDFKKEDRLSVEERSHIKVNEYRTRSCLLCPLIMGNEILGVMTFSDKRGSLAFTEDDLRLVQLIAKDVAMLSLHARFQNMVDHFVSEKLNELNKTA